MAAGAPCALGGVRPTRPFSAPELGLLPGAQCGFHLGLTPKENSLCYFVSVPPTPLPTNDVDVYFETSADDNEHARFQKAKEQLEIRHRNRMDRVNLGAALSQWGLALGNMVFMVEGKGPLLPRLSCCVRTGEL